MNNENAANDEESSQIDWEKVGEDHNLSPDELAIEVFATAASLLSYQMEDRDLDAISIPMGGVELSLQKVKKEPPKYEH